MGLAVADCRRDRAARPRYGSSVRAATPEDVPAVRTLLARAFADDPMMRWMFPAPRFPDAAARAEALAAYLGLHVERYLTALTGGLVVERAGAITAAALWRRPDEDLATPAVLPTSSGLLTALIGPEHAATVAAGFAAERAVRPTGPHAYLHYLAVDADHRGQGDARRLVDAGLARASADGLPALVETTNPANVPLYEHLGFAVAASVPLGDGPTVWILTTAAAPR